MKIRLFLNALMFTIIIASMYALSYLVPSWIGLQRFNSSIVFSVMRIVLSCTWLAGITYKVAWDKTKIKTIRTRILFLFLFLIALIITWTIHATYNLTNVYLSIKQPSRGWRNNPHKADALLGFKPVPNARGFHTFPVGEDIPMKYDENGFRVPLSYDHSASFSKKPRILFLGCSFTYGDACTAEETFPFLVEKILDGYTINAGVCSYGLSQMFILAQSLIPKYKPDIVVFQHSPWLAERALSQYAPVYSSVMPTPYFDKHNRIVPPLFTSNIFNYPMDHFKETQKSFPDYFSFFSVCFPLYVQDDFKMARSNIGQLLSLFPKPNKDEQSTERFVIHHVHEICKQNNCKLILLDLLTPYLKQGNYTVDKNENIPEANADSCLHANLVAGESYEKKYNHYAWNGKDSVLTDTHPNRAAHKIIADEIVRVINSVNAQH